MDKHNGGMVHTAYESDIEDETENRLRVSENSQIAQLDAEALAVVAARSCPTASTINIDKSSRVHIGPKIVSVVQNVDNNEKVKGESISIFQPTRHFRCDYNKIIYWNSFVTLLFDKLDLSLIFNEKYQIVFIAFWMKENNVGNAKDSVNKYLCISTLER